MRSVSSLNPRFQTRRVPGLAALLLLATSPALAEVVHEFDRDSNLHTYRMTVSAAPEPTPAFQHRFIKPRTELKESNAPAFYRRIYAENDLRGKNKRLENEIGEQWYDWATADTPLSEIPLEQLRRAANMFQYEVTHGARAGADSKHCDWGLAIEQIEGIETIQFLLPEFQGMRNLARGVALNARLAIAERRFDDAVDFLRINYRLAADTGQVPLLVCVLIGDAVVGITYNSALDLIAAPDSPNLYWALSELPDPIVPMREALRFEMSIGPRIFPLLKDAETAVRAPEEWNRLFHDAAEIMPQLVSGRLAWRTRALAEFGGVGAGILGYPHAKRRLVEWGYSSEEVDAMAVGQVLAIYSARTYQFHADNMEKAFYTGFSQSQQLLREADQQLGDAGSFSENPDRELFPVAEALVPAVSACRNAEMRIRRDVAALRVIEALRMHAAEQGSLPDSLDVVTCVPVPLNPATDRPFDYSLSGEVAVLDLPQSDGVHTGRRYEIQLAE